MASGRKMRRMVLFGATMVLALVLGIVVPVFGATGDAVAQATHGHHKVPPIARGTTLTITGSGTAYKIGNRTVTESASISLSATVVRSSLGRGLLNFTSGSLTVGSVTYTVVRGNGIVNFHSDKMVLHLVVKDSAGKIYRLILHGSHAKASSTASFTVDFSRPQSKLGHLWFLKFPSATVTPK